MLVVSRFYLWIYVLFGWKSLWGVNCDFRILFFEGKGGVDGEFIIYV